MNTTTTGTTTGTDTKSDTGAGRRRAARTFTAAEMEQGFNDAVVRLRQVVRPPVAITLVVAVLAAGAWFAWMSAGQNYRDQYAAGQDTLDQLYRERAETADIARTLPTDVQIGALAQAARDRAAQVAAFQNQFADLAWAGRDQRFTDPDTPTPAEQAMVEHRATGKDLFDPSALIATAEEVDQFLPWYSFADNEFDPRFPWYLHQQNGTISDPATYQWQVTAVVPDTADPGITNPSVNQAGVVWSCTNPVSGEVYAVATGVYRDQNPSDTEPGRFERLTLTITQAARLAQKGQR